MKDKPKNTEEKAPEGYEWYGWKTHEGDQRRPFRLVAISHDHYDRDGYCDNPARGY